MTSEELQDSLEISLRRRLSGQKSTLYVLAPGYADMQLGAPIFQLRASPLRTSANGFGSWPTPRAADGEKNVRTAEGSAREVLRKGSPQDLAQAAHQSAGWPTPCAQDAASHRNATANRKPESKRGNPGVTLTDAATFAGWATPAAKEAGGTAEQFLDRKRKAVAGGAQLGVSLTSLSLQAQMAGNASEALGPPPTGSRVGTAKSGQLRPGHSRWLQGYPGTWESCAGTGTR